MSKSSSPSSPKVTFSLWYSPTATSPERNHHRFDSKVTPTLIANALAYVRQGRPTHWWLVNNVTGEKIVGVEAVREFMERESAKMPKSSPKSRSSPAAVVDSPANNDDPKKPKDCVGAEDMVSLETITDKETAVILDKKCYDGRGIYSNIKHGDRRVPHSRRVLSDEEVKMITELIKNAPFEMEYSVASIAMGWSKSISPALVAVFETKSAGPTLKLVFAEGAHTSKSYVYEFESGKIDGKRIPDDDFDVYAADFKMTIPREEKVRMGELRNTYPGPKNIAEEINRRRLAMPISAVKLTVKGKGSNIIVDEKEKLTAAEKESAPFIRVQE